MATHGGGHVPGYKPAHTNQGWGIALLVCALAVALWITAWTIHRNTYRHPLDPLAPLSGQSEGGGHGAPGAATGGGGH